MVVAGLYETMHKSFKRLEKIPALIPQNRDNIINSINLNEFMDKIKQKKKTRHHSKIGKIQVRIPFIVHENLVALLYPQNSQIPAKTSPDLKNLHLYLDNHEYRCFMCRLGGFLKENTKDAQNSRFWITHGFLLRNSHQTIISEKILSEVFKCSGFRDFYNEHQFTNLLYSHRL